MMQKIRNKTRAVRSTYQKRKNRTNTRAQLLSSRPRLIVYRSNKYIYAQIVDSEGNVICACNDDAQLPGTKKEKSYIVGEKIAKKAQDSGVSSVTFDRNGFAYHGRVASLAEGARAGGLHF